MWELDYKESWIPKNWCFWTVLLEKTLESPLDFKEIQPVHPKGNQSWTFIGRTDVEAETPILWPPDVETWLIWKDPNAGRDWGQEEKGMTEDEMVGWHHWLNGHEFGLTLEVGDGQGGLVCCGPWSRKESDTTEWLSWTELMNLFAGWQWRHRPSEQTCGHSGGRRGWDEWRQQRGDNIHHHTWDRELVQISCVTQGAHPVPRDHLEGWDRVGGGGGGSGGRGPR